MPELRQDPIIHNWVIIATERAKRPSDFPRQQATSQGGACPFCPGHEKETPPEVFGIRTSGAADSPGWQVRVVPNKFAALMPDSPRTSWGEPPHRAMAGFGRHEVIIETPDHEATFADLHLQHARQVVATWQQRFLVLEQVDGIAYSQLFKNQGALAGASLEHPHSQIIATPTVPVTIEAEVAGVAAYQEEHGQCPFCELVIAEAEEEQRVVSGNRDFLVFTPFASRFPFETWIVPREHQPHFGRATTSVINSLAGILQETLQRLHLLLDTPPYNLILHSAPYREKASYHWHLELLPRLTTVAGFEWGTGYYINPTPPEMAAASLREVKLPVGTYS